jgi:hypothetical protein
MDASAGVDPSVAATDPVTLIRERVNTAISVRAFEALSDPLVCWFILLSAADRAATVRAADAWMKSTPVST